MKNTSLLTFLVILTGLAPVCAPSTAEAAVLHSFDQLFIGDDATEGFEFDLSHDPAVPTTIRFSGFAENLHLDAEGSLRFYLGWQTNRNFSSNTAAIFRILHPPWPDYLNGVDLPPADPVSGPARIPITFEASTEFSPGWVKFTVEGLTGDDNFRFVGDLTIEPEPRLRVSRVGPGVIELAWTTNSTGYRLESAATFPGSSWTAVTNAVTQSGGDFSVRIQSADALQFYRLRKP